MRNVFTNRKIENNYSLRRRVPNNLPEGQTYVLSSFLQRMKGRKARRNITMGIDFMYMTSVELKHSVCVQVYMQSHMNTRARAHTHKFVKVYISF